ncbi:MAG: cobalt-precorrin 5A hydrolase [Lachnospiraceae bacterium]|nr:cobalt-precorrin 5A hydrolase [Lachnospiraceae bacterium]
MKRAVVTFTQKGELTGNKLRETVPEFKCADQYNAHGKNDPNGLHNFIRDNFVSEGAIVFIGACGIAVRLIAPLIKDKLRDPAVIVMDELGRHVIPILSGHIGGANELGLIIAEVMDAEPIITTATDLNDLFAVDMYAKSNGLEPENKDDIVKISSRVLDGAEVSIRNDDEDGGVYITSNDAEIHLRSKPIIVGIGCKKGTSYAMIDNYIKFLFEVHHIDINDVSSVATIDLKRDEEGLVEWCDHYKKRMFIFSAEELAGQKGEFSSSEFVRQTTGVDNVCERAVVAAGGEIIVKKTAQYGVSVAIGRKL